jgi:Transglutaminase-like superfamily
MLRPPMWERFRRFSALDREARWLFLRAGVLLPLISLSLRLRGFRATQASLQKFLPCSLKCENFSDGIRDVVPSEGARKTIRMLCAAVRYGPGSPTCLEESLALWWLLGRQGIATTVRIGTRKLNGRFEAHAWTECDGVALNEPEDPHHHYAAFDAAFDSLPTESR